jgi:GR25 family glycosyltransferase involved in LPS biosynthesis
MPTFRGFFINLDRNKARLESMTKQLAEVGMSDRYERFPAVDGRTLGAEYAATLDRGALGLWLTHERLLSANKSSDAHLHLLEDDTVLPKDAAACFADLLAQAETDCPDWDVILTEMFVDMSFSMFRLLAKWKEEYQQEGKVRLLPVKSYPSAGTTSLFINAKSIGKYLGMIEGRWTDGAPIDLFLRGQINRGFLNAYITVPFATTLPDNSIESDIRGGLDVSHKVVSEYRRAWFKDADLTKSAREMRRLTATAKVSSLTECYLEAVKFVLSDQWVQF